MNSRFEVQGVVASRKQNVPVEGNFMSSRHAKLLDANRSRLLIVDMQEKLLPSIHEGPLVEQRCGVLAEVAQLFEIPMRITEQYPKGLGSTVESLRSFDGQPPEKLAFSAAEATGWGKCSDDEPRNQAVVCGIESHICVLQTAFDLIARSWSVAVVVDAIGSRSQSSHDAALSRLSAEGVSLVTTEMVLFEWAERAGTESFKTISKIVRNL